MTRVENDLWNLKIHVSYFLFHYCQVLGGPMSEIGPVAPSFKKSGGFLMQNTTKTHQKMLCFRRVFSTCSHKEIRNKKIPKSLINLKDVSRIVMGVKC